MAQRITPWAGLKASAKRQLLTLQKFDSSRSGGGISTVTFPVGEETGLVQLRDLLQKAGLRDLEREATFAIERGETEHSLDDWKQNPAGAAEGIFRYVAFDLTTA